MLGSAQPIAGKSRQATAKYFSSFIFFLELIRAMQEKSGKLGILVQPFDLFCCTTIKLANYGCVMHLRNKTPCAVNLFPKNDLTEKNTFLRNLVPWFGQTGKLSL